MSKSYWDKVAQPYTKDPASGSAKNKRQAIKQLLESMRGMKVRRVKDCFGGKGIQTEEVLNVFPHAEVTIQDLDSNCVKYLRVKFRDYPGVKIHRVNSFVDADDNRYDLTLWDTNTFTLLNWQKLEELRKAIRRAMGRTRLFVLTDAASYRIWINYKSYDCEGPDYAEYIERLEEVVFKPMGFGLVDYAGRSEAHYILFRRLK